MPVRYSVRMLPTRSHWFIKDQSDNQAKIIDIMISRTLQLKWRGPKFLIPIFPWRGKTGITKHLPSNAIFSGRMRDGLYKSDSLNFLPGCLPIN
jgi:hypothetical protein